MRIATNEKLVQSRARIGQIFGLGGLAILVGGLFLSFQPQYFVVSYVALLVGVLVSSIGVYNADKWIKPPRADQALQEALKGLDNKHRLYNWVLPVNHVLFGPTGLTVFTVKNQEGRIEYDGQRWRHRQGWFQLLGSFSRERLGNPGQELATDIDKLRGIVERVAPGADVPIDGYVVFTNPKAVLSVANGSVPAVPVKKPKPQVKGQAKRARLPDETRRQVEAALDEIAAPKASEVQESSE